MISTSTLSDRRGLWAFILGVIAVTAGVLLHLPMFLMGRHNHFMLAGMPIGWDMIAGMAAIIIGIGIASYGLLPRNITEQLAALQDVLGSLQDARVLAGELGAAFVEAAGEQAQRACDLLMPWAPVVEPTAGPSPPADQAGLVALAGRIGNEYEATFARFHREWLEEGAASLLFQLHQIGSGRRQLLRRARGGPGSRRTRRRPGVPVAVRPIRRMAAGKVATRAAK